MIESMSRTLINFCLDVLLLLLTLGLAWTTCLLKVVFPRATRAGGWTIWALDYDTWSNVQVGLLGSFLLAVLLHLMLHWSWVSAVVRTRMLRRSGKVDDGTGTLYGVGTLILVVLFTVGFLVTAELTIQSPVRP